MPARRQLLVDGHLLGTVLGGESAGHHDRPAEHHAPAGLGRDQADLMRLARRVGGVGAQQDERGGGPVDPPHLREGRHLARLLDQVEGRFREHKHRGVDRSAGSEETR